MANISHFTQTVNGVHMIRAHKLPYLAKTYKVHMLVLCICIHQKVAVVQTGKICIYVHPAHGHGTAQLVK